MLRRFTLVGLSTDISTCFFVCGGLFQVLAMTMRTRPVFIDHGAGFVVSYDEMMEWFNLKLDMVPLDAPRLDNSWSMVFTK